MDAHQTTFELAMEPTGHPLATTPCWAALLEAGELLMFPGDGLLAPYQWGEKPPGELRTPYGSRDAKAWAMCGQHAISALMGCSLDFIRRCWCERVHGDATRGTTAMEMIEFVGGFCGTKQCFTVDKPDGPNSWKQRWSKDLLWPVCGLVAVTLPDGEKHWVAALNEMVSDNLIGHAVPLLEWHQANSPYAIDDVIILGQSILRRDHRWKISNDETHLNGGF